MTEELQAAQAQLEEFARDIRQLYDRERQRAKELEAALDELNRSYFSTMETLAFLIEAKDEGTRQHLDRTRHLGMALTRAIAPELASRAELEYAFLLHDIGKIGIPETVLCKPGPLTPSEWSVMRTHPLIGAQIVLPIRVLGDAVDVVRHHHERYDGRGYPDGLRGGDIPLAARIFSVVDAYDAMTSERPYRRARSMQQAIEEIVRCSGSQFDPEVVESFTLVIERTVSTADTLEHAPQVAG